MTETKQEPMSPFFLNPKTLSKFMHFAWDEGITIFVPCYNEEGNIINTFNTLIFALEESESSWEIIVIDDGSSDKSVELISNYQNDHPGYPIRLIVREENIGLAQNYIDAAFIAKKKYYKLVSGDNAEPKKTLKLVFDEIGKADMIIPYHTAIEGRSFIRHVFSKSYTFIVNSISGNKFKYYNGGAVHLTQNVIRWHTDYHGFSFQADIITRLMEQGMNFHEVAVTSQERETGSSKALKLKNFLSVGHFLLDLIIRRIGCIYRSSNN
jgi:glycosyltransferase involved in cell wall biosynthesis